MTMGPWVLHNAFKEYEGDGTVDLDNDSFVLRVFDNTSNVTDITISDATTLTGQLPTANGYTSGGIAMTMTWTRDGAIVTLGASTVSFAVNTDEITARYVAIIDTTVAPDLVVAHAVLDATPADVIVEPGASFVVRFPNGIYSR